jgi:hypothetical protein
MILQISLGEQEYTKLASVAVQSGRPLDQFLHEVIYRLIKRPSTLDELAELQYLEGNIAHIPTGRPLTQEEFDEHERLARLFAGGKPVSEMVIEDRGPY